MQCIVWNTWGPIESGAEFAFGWDKSVVRPCQHHLGHDHHGCHDQFVMFNFISQHTLIRFSIILINITI